MRVHLDIEVGEHAVDYNELAGKEKLTELQLRVRQLLDQVEQISKEQNYQRVTKTIHSLLFNQFLFILDILFDFSTARKDFALLVSLQISECFGGLSLSYQF